MDTPHAEPSDETTAPTNIFTVISWEALNQTHPAKHLQDSSPQKMRWWDFPGGPVVINTENADLMPSQETKITCVAAVSTESVCSRAQEPQLEGNLHSTTTDPACCN